MANVLIIDDDEPMCHMLVELVESIEHNAKYALTLETGVEMTLSGTFDVVFLDVKMPDGSGLKALELIREASSAPEVIIITGAGDPNGAEIAIRNGAWDYLQKPISPKNIIFPLKNVLQYRDNQQNSLKAPTVLKREGIIGDSTKMMACLQAVAIAANSDASVLVTGETGTGKELIARAIHNNSSRSLKNFVTVDCTTLSETLSGSQLFGYKKSAFTGAEESRDGLIQHANKGTLFLDEIGELSLDLQKIFLRVLQERRYRPLGEKQEIESDFRLISATNKDLDEMARKGQFRVDLLFRLRTTSINIPPLRERLEDIKKLVIHHGCIFFSKYGMDIKGFSPDFFNTLSSYPWPGNVRELINTLEGSIHNAYQEPTLYSTHLPKLMRIHMAQSAFDHKKDELAEGNPTDSTINTLEPPKYKAFRERVLAKAEKQYFQDLMRLTEGNIKEACRITGLGRTRLYTLMRKYKISRTGWFS